MIRITRTLVNLVIINTIIVLILASSLFFFKKLLAKNNLTNSSVEIPSLNGTTAKNAYPIWVYPANINNNSQSEIKIAENFNNKTIEILNKGGKVLLLPDTTLQKNAVGGAFESNFWCYPMYKKYSPPGTLGILCDPKHPVFSEFPTEFHSNWQWWPMLKYGKAMILDSTPENFRPIVQVIDNFERNHKLAVMFECKVGKGKLLVCSCNLNDQQQYPEARQLFYSILKYMKSDDFEPNQILNTSEVQKIFKEQNKDFK